MVLVEFQAHLPSLGAPEDHARGVDAPTDRRPALIATKTVGDPPAVGPIVWDRLRYFFTSVEL